MDTWNSYIFTTTPFVGCSRLNVPYSAACGKFSWQKSQNLVQYVSTEIGATQISRMQPLFHFSRFGRRNVDFTDTCIGIANSVCDRTSIRYETSFVLLRWNAVLCGRWINGIQKLRRDRCLDFDLCWLRLNGVCGVREGQWAKVWQDSVFLRCLFSSVGGCLFFTGQVDGLQNRWSNPGPQKPVGWIRATAVRDRTA